MLLSVKYWPPFSCLQSKLYIILIGYFHNNYNSKSSFESKSFKQNSEKSEFVINMNEAKLSHIVKAKKVPQKPLDTQHLCVAVICHIECGFVSRCVSMCFPIATLDLMHLMFASLHGYIVHKRNLYLLHISS